MHALHDKNSLCTFVGYSVLEWNTVKTLQCTAPALLLLFLSLWHETAQLLHRRRRAMDVTEVGELESEGSTVRPLAAPA